MFACTFTVSGWGILDNLKLHKYTNSDSSHERGYIFTLEADEKKDPIWRDVKEVLFETTVTLWA